MAEKDIVHIALEAPDTLDPDLINQIATIIGRNPLDTRLLMAGGIPKIIAHYESVEIANQIVEKINTLGVRSLAIKDIELSEPPESFQVQTLEIRNKQILFLDDRGKDKIASDDDISLIIVGRQEVSVMSQSTTIKTKFNLTGTLLSGGIPMWHRVKEQNTSESTETTFFARLYENKLPGSWIELAQERLKYTFLGKLVAPSTLTNFNNLLQQIKDFFPDVIFDDRLTKASVFRPSSYQPWQNTNATCKLIYLFHAIDRNHPTR